jgi:hypothetical protein
MEGKASQPQQVIELGEGIDGVGAVRVPGEYRDLVAIEKRHPGAGARCIDRRNPKARLCNSFTRSMSCHVHRSVVLVLTIEAS